MAGELPAPPVAGPVSPVQPPPPATALVSPVQPLSLGSSCDAGCLPVQGAGKVPFSKLVLL